MTPESPKRYDDLLSQILVQGGDIMRKKGEQRGSVRRISKASFRDGGKLEGVCYKVTITAERVKPKPRKKAGKR